MNRLFLLVAAPLLMCCTDNHGAPRIVEPNIVIIDSCEYIKAPYRLTHKGNCKYCIERRKQEYREIVKELFDMQD